MKVVYTACDAFGDLTRFEEPCTSEAEAVAYAARVRSLQQARGLPCDAHVETGGAR